MLVVDGTNALCRCRGDVPDLKRMLAAIRSAADEPERAVCVFDPPATPFKKSVRRAIDDNYKAERRRRAPASSASFLGDDGGSFLTEDENVAIPASLGPRVSPPSRRPAAVRRRRLAARLAAVADAGFRPLVARQGYEADDAAAAVVALAARHGLFSAVASADTDMANLLRPGHVVWMRCRYGARAHVDAARVTHDEWQAEHGFPPSLYADYVALAEAVPSRVAKLLVKRFGDAEAVLDAAAEHVAEGGDGGATSNATPPKWLRALPDVHASRDKVRKKLRLAVLRDGPEALADGDAEALFAWLAEEGGDVLEPM